MSRTNDPFPESPNSGYEHQRDWSVEHVSQWSDAKSLGAAEFASISVDNLLAIYKCFDLLEKVWPTDPSVLTLAGPFELEEEIGRGGMGSVWRARQLEPIRRTVAIKLITPGPKSERIVKRFESERNVLAMMNHPGIASIIDAGKTNEGQPYFAMELVDGPNLIQYCHENQLKTQDRLLLFLDACSAVQHAHQKGIVHRDLKPSNILVGRVDGSPQVKVIDFGLSKFDGQKPTSDEHSNATHRAGPLANVSEDGQVIGSVRYMSPEQAAGGRSNVDTRADIYSLGIVLYRLLADSTPLGGASYEKASVRELLNTIQFAQVLRPSESLGETAPEDLKAAVEARQTQWPQYQRMLREDLDWIVMKAIEKQPEHRYSTVSELTADIKRHLNHEPVLAAPASRLYASRKFFARNRGIVAALATTFAVLVFGILGTLISARWAIMERDRAVVAENGAVRITELRDIEIRALRLSTADKDWSLGNCESAWQSLSQIKEQDGWELDFLRQRFSSETKTIFGHAAWLECVDTSPDGKWIASGSQDYTTKIWNAANGTAKHTFSHDEIISHVRFSEDSKLLLAGSKSNELLLYCLETFELLKTFGPFESDVLCAEFSACGKFLIAGTGETDSSRSDQSRIYSAGKQSQLVVLSLDTGDVIQRLDAHEKDINSISTSQKESQVASACSDGSIRIWTQSSVGKLSPIKTLVEHQLSVSDISYSPDGDLLASSSADNTVLIWDTRTHNVVRAFSEHDGPVSSVRFASDGERIVTSSGQNTARLWSIEGELLKTCRGHFSSLVGASFIAGADSIVTASTDKTLKIWDASHSPNTIYKSIHDRKIWDIEVSPDSSVVASAGADGSVRFTNPKNGSEARNPIQHSVAMLSLAFRPDSGQLAYGGKDSKVHVIDMTNGESLQTLAEHKDHVWTVDYSPDGERLVTGSADHTAIVWDTTSWSPVGKLVGHTDEIASAEFSHDRKWIVTASDDHSVVLWNATTFEREHVFAGHSDFVWRARFAPDDSMIASSDRSGKILFWDVQKRKLIRTIEAHNSDITGLAFDKSGKRLLSASYDRSIRVWETASGIELFSTPEHDGEEAICVALSNQNQIMATGNGRGGITLFKTDADLPIPMLPSEVRKHSLKQFEKLKQHDLPEDEVARSLDQSLEYDRKFPSLPTLRNTGIAYYRLGKYQQAIVSLDEAKRVHHLQFGETHFDPFIEAFRILALIKLGDTGNAMRAHQKFDSQMKTIDRNQEKNLGELIEELNDVFETASANK